MNDLSQCLLNDAEREVIVSCVFDSPQDLVFRAWTNPKHIEKWWGPAGYTNSDCELDLRVNGVFRLKMHRPDGTVYSCEGVFRENVTNERIVFAGPLSSAHPCGGGIPARSSENIIFDDHEGKTKLTIIPVCRRKAISTLLGRQESIQAGNRRWSDSQKHLQYCERSLAADGTAVLNRIRDFDDTIVLCHNWNFGCHWLRKCLRISTTIKICTA